MRNKFAWIAIISIVAFIFILSPFITGIYFEKKYKQILSLYKDSQQLQFKLVEYHRGWFHSEAVLSVQLQNLDLITDEALPKEYIIDQYIQHGPIIYRYTEILPSFFGLGAIHNVLRYTAEIKSFFAKYQLNNHLFTVNDDFITFNGNFYKHIKLSVPQIQYPRSDVHIALSEFEGETWFWPNQERISGSFNLEGLSIADENEAIAIPSIQLQFDQHENRQNFWLGNNTLVIPEITLQEMGRTTLAIYGVHLNGYFDENAGLLQGSRQLDITKMNIDDIQAGPFHLQLSVNKLNLEAIINMVHTYQDIKQRGELYQSQLQQKMYTMLPDVINQGSMVKLDGLDILTPQGVLQVNGELAWGMNKASIPDNVVELLQSANAKLNLRISKALMDKWIEIVSRVVLLKQPNAMLQQAYINAKQNIRQAMLENSENILVLESQGQIAHQDAFNLLMSQKQMVSINEYNDVIRNLLLHKAISLETSHVLSYLYAQVQNPVIELAKLMKENNEVTQGAMRAQIANWVKEGYIKQEDDDYIMSLSQGANGIKINEKWIPTSIQ